MDCLKCSPELYGRTIGSATTSKVVNKEPTFIDKEFTFSDLPGKTYTFRFTKKYFWET